MSVIERMINVMLEDLSAAFEPVSPVTFRFERIEVNPRFASVALPTNAAMVGKFHVDIEDRGGDFELVMPYSTMEPVRSHLSQVFLGENLGDDRNWTQHFGWNVKESEIELDAELSRYEANLKDVLAWGKGSVINLDIEPGASIRIKSGDAALFEGRIGSHRGHIAVKLDKWVAHKSETFGTAKTSAEHHEHKS